MPEDGDEMPRLLRDRHIKAVRDRFHRPPTINELRAIDALPLESRKNLNDTSPNGQKIYEFLRRFEKTGYFEGLEEAGRLLWVQIFAEPNFSQEPRREPCSAVRNIATRGISEVKYKASQHPTRIPKEKPLQQTSAEKVMSINATSNIFAGSPQKSWMTKGVSVSPTPRRASISSVENNNSNGPANFNLQSSDTQPVSVVFTQSCQQTQNLTSTLTTSVPGGPPNTYGGGVYTPWPMHHNAQQHQYASPYPIQASKNSISAVSRREEPARDMISCSNIPSSINDESRVPAQEQSFHANYTSNLKTESTNRNTSMENSYHTTRSYKPYPSAILETNRFDQPTFSTLSPQLSPWGHQDSMISSPGNYSEYSPLPLKQNPHQPSDNAVYRDIHIASSTGTTYDPTSPPFHPATSAEAKLLFLGKEEEKSELACQASNTPSTLPGDHGDQQTKSSSTIVAATALANTSSTRHRSQLATSSSSMHQSPSSDISAVAPGQLSHNHLAIRDDMGFIPLTSQEITDQDMNLTPNNLLPMSSRRTTRSVSSSATTSIPPLSKASHLDTSGPRSGILIPENPLRGTSFSTNTQKALSVHNAKKNSLEKRLLRQLQFPLK